MRHRAEFSIWSDGIIEYFDIENIKEPNRPEIAPPEAGQRTCPQFGPTFQPTDRPTESDRTQSRHPTEKVQRDDLVAAVLGPNCEGLTLPKE